MYISAMGELRRADRRARGRPGSRVVRRVARGVRGLTPVAAGFVPGAGGVIATQVADRRMRPRAPRRVELHPRRAPDVRQAEAARRAAEARGAADARGAVDARRAEAARAAAAQRGERARIPRQPRREEARLDFWERAQPVIDVALQARQARQAWPVPDTALERFADEGGPWALLPQQASAPGLRAPGAPASGLLPGHQQVDRFDDHLEPFTADVPGISPTTMLVLGGIALVAFMAVK